MFSLNEQAPDRRISRLEGKPLTTSSAYGALWMDRPMDPMAPAIWNNYAPNKCRLFLWLAHKDRLYTNERRCRRGIATTDMCPFCNDSESINHLLFSCVQIRPIWAELNSLCHTTPDSIITCWGSLTTDKIRSTVIIAILWNMWKRRNAKVFRADTQDAYKLLCACADDLMLWSNRCSTVIKKSHLQEWSSMLLVLAGRM